MGREPAGVEVGDLVAGDVTCHGRLLSQERSGETAVDRDDETGGPRERTFDEHGHGLGNVFGENLTTEQAATRVVLTQAMRLDAVRIGALLQPLAREDARTAYDGVRVDAVDTDAVQPELGGEQSDLVELIGLGRSIRDIRRSRNDTVLRRDVDDVTAGA